MNGIDYTTDWLTEEEAPVASTQRQQRPAPRQQQGTLYLRECGPKAAVYAVIGGCIGFLIPIVFGLLAMFLKLLFGW